MSPSMKFDNSLKVGGTRRARDCRYGGAVKPPARESVQSFPVRSTAMISKLISIRIAPTERYGRPDLGDKQWRHAQVQRTFEESLFQFSIPPKPAYLLAYLGSSYSPSTSYVAEPSGAALPLYVPFPLMPLSLPVPPVKLQVPSALSITLSLSEAAP